MNATRISLAVLVSMLCMKQAEGTNLIVNGDFEAYEDTVGPKPTTYGNWQGDYSYIVTTQSGIAPPSGLRMLRFIYTLPTGPNAVSSKSDMWQIIDVGPFAQEIAQGLATATASAKYNRVLGNVHTDTQFDVRLVAYAGLPSSFPSQYDVSELAVNTTSILTDGDVATWETATVELPLPTNTDFIAIALAAVENVYNDGVYPEFEGHYTDDVVVTIIPEPSTLTLLSVGALVLRAWRRKRA